MIGIIILGLIKSATRSNIHVNQILLTVAIILTMALDFCLTIVFLIGGHRVSKEDFQSDQVNYAFSNYLSPSSKQSA